MIWTRGLLGALAAACWAAPVGGIERVAVPGAELVAQVAERGDLEPGAKTTPRPEPEAEPGRLPEPEPEPEAQPGAGTEAEVEPEPEPEPEPGPEVRVIRDRDGNQTRRGKDPEMLILGTGAAVLRAEEVVARSRGKILRRARLDGLGLATSVFEIGPHMTLPILRSRIARQEVDVAVDANSTYAPADPGRSYVAEMLGLPAVGGCELRRPVRIGIIDGPVDQARTAAAGITLTGQSVLGAGERPAGDAHATDLVMLMAARAGDGTVAGIAPGARVYSAGAFAREGQRVEMRLDDMAAAMDWLVSQRVEVVNLSLAGQRNDVLTALMAAAAGRGIVLVAATGNDGRDRVAYPAADPNVISVTAVDASGRRFRAANRGREVDFAAPGVDVLIPGAEGPRYRSGTSYATAVVSGLVAHDLARGVRGRADILAALAARVEDLGPPGRDSEFGWGLARSGGC